MPLRKFQLSWIRFDEVRDFITDKLVSVRAEKRYRTIRARCPKDALRKISQAEMKIGHLPPMFYGLWEYTEPNGWHTLFFRPKASARAKWRARFPKYNGLV